ncbi:MAG: hypothetical protein JKY37_01955 [Nannocystaceae bacterium]|nr:hypothetical protein [Nannocystaceae bacterium]
MKILNKNVVEMSKWWILGGVAGLFAGCWQHDTNACANRDGDASCDEGMFCDRCEPSNNGCVGNRPTESDEHGPCYTPTVDEGGNDESQASSSSTVGQTHAGTGSTAAVATEGATDDPTTGSGSGTTTGSRDTSSVCEGDEDCGDAVAPFCDGEGVCVSCDGMPDGNAACGEADAGLAVCDGGECVQCAAGASEACDGQTPVCDEEVRTCGACVEHSECPESACHLDGGDVGGCFDEGDGVTAGSTAQLEAAFSGAGANADVVVVLTGSNYSNVSIDFVTNAEVAVIGDGSQDISGNTSGGIVGTGGSSIVYFAGVSIAGNISGDGLSCSGTSVWLDDSEVRNNAQVGLDVSGGCAAHLRRTVVAVNNGGGIDQVGGELRMTNSVVALNGGSVSPFGGLSIDGVDILVSYTTIAGNDSQNTGMSIRCSGANTGEVRNSIVSGEDASSVDPCAGVRVLSSGVDEGGLGGTNTNVGAFDPGWFSNPAMGNYHLTGSGETVFMDIADWVTGDPLFDVDGDPIPTDMPSFAGYDQP